MPELGNLKTSFSTRRRGRIDVYVLLLAGVTASYLLSAVITVLMIHANNNMGAILYWLLGSFRRAPGPTSRRPCSRCPS